jgi:hypothetical protein
MTKDRLFKGIRAQRQEPRVMENSVEREELSPITELPTWCLAGL